MIPLLINIASLFTAVLGFFEKSTTEFQLTMRSNRNYHQLMISLLLLSSLLLFAPSINAKSKSRSSISDVEIRLKKNDCYADIESGLWGWHCKSSAISKENCALKCLSPACYELVYESDPLEEGEKDFIRGQEYRYCLQKSSMGESLDGIKGAFDY